MFASLARLGAVRSVGTSIRCVSSQALVHRAYGSPENVLNLEKVDTGDVTKGQLQLKWLAAPINPADINLIQGVYPSPPPLPAVAGSEGVAVVEKVGEGVSGIKTGDWVVPTAPSLGTWQTHSVVAASSVSKVPSDLPVEYAATLSVNPCTALRLLDDFVQLQSGDVIVQNGANSSVGQSVIQLARKKGVKTINVIRSRPDQAETVERMKAYGGDIVITEEYLRTPEFRRLVSDLPAPKLALNCTGGRSATDIARLLDNGGTMVTYGGMSRRAVQLPTSLLIFRNIQVKGFWLSDWTQKHSKQEQQNMLDTVANMARSGDLRLWIEKHKFSSYRNAVDTAQHEQRNRKVVLVMDS